MNITILGTGKMAVPLAKYLAQANHRVFIGSRDQARAEKLANKMGLGIKGTSIQTAVAEGNIIILAVPYSAMNATLKTAGTLDDKIVVDVSNCFTSDFSNLTLGHTTSAAEEIAKQIPNANVVKAFNTIFATILEKGLNFGEQKLNVFIASDNTRAKQMIKELVESIGLLPVDCGELKSARFLEPLAALTLQIDSNLQRDVQIAASILERAQPVLSPSS